MRLPFEFVSTCSLRLRTSSHSSFRGFFGGSDIRQLLGKKYCVGNILEHRIYGFHPPLLSMRRLWIFAVMEAVDTRRSPNSPGHG